jgi:hypothetical protein
MGQFRVAVQTLVDEDIPEKFSDTDPWVDVHPGNWQAICHSASGVISLFAARIPGEEDDERVNMLNYDLLEFIEDLGEQGPAGQAIFGGSCWCIRWTN